MGLGKVSGSTGFEAEASSLIQPIWPWEAIEDMEPFSTYRELGATRIVEKSRILL